MGAAESGNQLIDNAFDNVNTAVEHWNDRLALERLSLSERYAVGQLDIGFLFVVGHRAT
jgi:hypothetical protein